MTKTYTSKLGVTVKSYIANNTGTFLTSVHAGTQHVAQHVEIGWTNRAYSIDVRVTSDVIQAKNALAHSGGSPWVCEAQAITKSVPRKQACGLQITSQLTCGIQAVIDYGTIEVWDNWKKCWVKDNINAQLAIDIL